MAKKNMNKKGRKIKEAFLYIPRSVYEHSDFFNLSGRAMKLLVELLSQYNGSNNGDLCIAMKLMRKRGWRSCDQLHKAKDELLRKNFIVVSRQGGKHCASLFAVMWLSVDYCKGKLDIKCTNHPLRNFRNS